MDKRKIQEKARDVAKFTQERKAGRLFASASAATLSGSAGAKVLNHNFFGIDE